MNTIKSLILGSAAGLLAFGSAQAADLPVKAKAVEYVKVCSLYGAGFYYIPGTDTCIKIGGAMRLDTAINSTIYANPFTAGAGGLNTRSRDYTSSRARFGFNVDTRTATEYGVVRTYANMQMQWTDSVDGIAGGNFETDYAFIQFAGFTFGKAVSQFDPQWVLAIPSVSSGHFGGSDTKTGIPQFAYTATFGNGFSGTISLEDPRPYRRGGVYDTSTMFVGGATNVGIAGTATGTNREAGVHMPDIVGNLRLDQAWGSLHFGAALHEATHSYYTGNEASGYATNKYGYAFTGGVELKNLPTGVGDTLRADLTYARGAARYVFGGTQNISGAGYAMFTSGGANFAQYADAYTTGNGTGLELSTAWSGRVFFEHYWNPKWRTSLYGIYSHYENSGVANASLMNRYNASIGAGNLTGDTGFNVWQIGSRTAWQPVQNLTFSAEVLYTQLDTNLGGTITNAGQFASKANGVYDIKNQGTVSGIVQVLRSF